MQQAQFQRLQPRGQNFSFVMAIIAAACILAMIWLRFTFIEALFVLVVYGVLWRTMLRRWLPVGSGGIVAGGSLLLIAVIALLNPERAPASLPVIIAAAAAAVVGLAWGLQSVNAAGRRGPYRFTAATDTLLKTGVIPSICQECGMTRPIKKTTFYRILGMIIAYQHGYKSGYMCFSCINSTFWEFSGITLLGGWWSITSFIITPLVLLNNVGRYLLALPLLFRSADNLSSQQAQLTIETARKLQPENTAIVESLLRGTSPARLSSDMAKSHDLPAGQVLIYIASMSPQLELTQMMRHARRPLPGQKLAKPAGFLLGAVCAAVLLNIWQPGSPEIALPGLALAAMLLLYGYGFIGGKTSDEDPSAPMEFIFSPFTRDEMAASPAENTTS